MVVKLNLTHAHSKNLQVKKKFHIKPSSMRYLEKNYKKYNKT